MGSIRRLACARSMRRRFESTYQLPFTHAVRPVGHYHRYLVCYATVHFQRPLQPFASLLFSRSRACKSYHHPDNRPDTVQRGKRRTNAYTLCISLPCDYQAIMHTWINRNIRWPRCSPTNTCKKIPIPTHLAPLRHPCRCCRPIQASSPPKPPRAVDAAQTPGPGW